MKPVPPVWMLLGIAGAACVGFFGIGPRIIDNPWTYSGYALALLGFVGVVLCFRRFRAHKTAIRPGRESNALVTSGLYRYSRNPIYVAITLVVLGASIASGHAAAFVFPVLFVAVIDRLFITMEERMLARTFGERYDAYRATTRRWL